MCRGTECRLGSGVGENVTRRLRSESVLLEPDAEADDEDEEEEESTRRGEGASPDGAFSLPLLVAKVEPERDDAPRRVKVGLTACAGPRRAAKSKVVPAGGAAALVVLLGGCWWWWCGRCWRARKGSPSSMARLGRG